MAAVESHPAGPTSLGTELLYAFGSLCGHDLHDAALFGDEVGEVLVQPLGRHLAFRHLGTGEMSFAVESERVEAITACAVSRDRELVAVCERCSEEPLTQVSVYGLHSAADRPEQTLQEFGGRVGCVTCAAFSPEAASSVLCLASGEPELLLVAVDWRLNVVLGRCQLAGAAERVAFSPLDGTVISASGPGFMRVWRLAEAEEGDADAEGAELLPFTEPEGLGAAALFVGHTWLEPPDGSFALCTAEGQVHLISSLEDDEGPEDGARAGGTGSAPGTPRQPGGAPGVPALRLLRTIDAPFQGALGGSVPLCLHCFPHGLLVGGSRGAVAIWERPRGELGVLGELRHVTTVQTGAGAADVRCLDVTGPASDLRVLLGFDDANIVHTSLDALRTAYGERARGAIIAGGFHSGPITSLDLAEQRPIMVSACRSDSSVRIWNYAVRRCELSWEFANEEPTSVAIHPLGYFLVVSFSDKLRFMQILVSELKLHRELSIRGVRLVRFAHGGHLVAAAQSKLVLVFSVRTLSKVATLRGHSQPVCSLCFDPDDRTLTTCAEDGSLCEWSTQCWTKLHDCAARAGANNAPPAQALTVGPDGQAFAGLAEGGRSLLRSFRHCAPLEEDDLPLSEELRVEALVHRAGPQAAGLFAGASDGSLHSYLLSAVPLGARLGLHRGACTAVCISGDARTAVTAGEDGVVFLLRINGLAPQPGHGEPGASAQGTPAPGGPVAEVVMINRGEIQARLEEREALSAETGRLKVQLVEDAARLEGECRARQQAAQQRDQEEIQALRLRYESLQQAATAKERESLRSMKAMEASHVQAADQLEQGYDRRIRQECERFVGLDAELQRLEQRLEAARVDSRRRLEQQRQRQELELTRRGREKDAEIQRLRDLAAFSQHRFDVMLDQEGMEHDLECSELNRRHQEELEQQRLVEYRRKKEQDGLIRGLDALEKDRERIRKEQDETRAVEAALRQEADGLQRLVAGLKAERRDREALLRDRETEIGSYKQKVSTLKKFRHVLDFRLREVAQSLQPKDLEVERLGEQLGEFEAELERQLVVQRQLEAALRQRRQQALAMQAEQERLREAVSARERSILRFTTDLHALATEEPDTRLWPQRLRRIYKDHVDPARAPRDGGLATQELGRQIQVMQQKAAALVAKSKHTEATCRADIGQKMEDNTELICEVDGLRLEKRGLERQVRDLEFKISLAEKRAAAGRSQGATSASGAGGRRRAPAALAAAPAAPAALAAEPAGAQTLRKRPQVPRATPEERSQLKQMLAAADRGNQRAQLQQIEQKLLRDHLYKLQGGESKR